MKVMDPEMLGFDPLRLERLRKQIESDIASEMFDGASIIVTRRGDAALYDAIGYASRDSGKKLQKNAVFFTSSTGKQFLNVMILNRIESGNFGLNTRVSEIIPEFAKRGKQIITVFHLLTHSSGLATTLMPNFIPPEIYGNLDQVVGAICDSAIEGPPGRLQYCAVVGHAILAEMLRRTDKNHRLFRDIMREDLFLPLGMIDTAVGKPAVIADRLCPAVVRDNRYSEGPYDPALIEDSNFIEEHAEVPAGGYTTTIEDLSKFSQMLRRNGELTGKRVLSPAMIELATRNYTGNQSGSLHYAKALRGWEPFPSNIGLGFFVRGEGIHPTFFGTLASPNSYGGLGSGTTCFWVDPKKDLTFSFLSTGYMEDTRHIERLQRYSDIIHSAVVR